MIRLMIDTPGNSRDEALITELAELIADQAGCSVRVAIRNEEKLDRVFNGRLVGAGEVMGQ